MALNTENKRRSAARRYHVPDGAIDSGSERVAVARRYSGITVAAPLTTLFTILVKVADIFPSAKAGDARPVVNAADIFPTATVYTEDGA